MKTDPYTKTILTIIAAALVLIAFKDAPISQSAYAQDAKDVKGATPVNIVAIDGVPFGALQISKLRPSLPVEPQR